MFGDQLAGWVGMFGCILLIKYKIKFVDFLYISPTLAIGELQCLLGRVERINFNWRLV